jgi:hypothetical protein
MALNDAQKARLQELHGQIPALKQLAKGMIAPEFKAWHAAVESVLKEAFGDTAPEFKKFIGISYQATALAATPSEKKVFYVRGLGQADAHLRQLLGE